MIGKDDHIGRRIAEAMRLRGVTQAQLAGQAGVSQGYVSSVLSGRKTPPSPKLVAALKQWGIVVDDLPDLPAVAVPVLPAARKTELLPGDEAAQLLARLQVILPEMAQYEGHVFELLAALMKQRPELEPRVRGYLEALLQEPGSASDNPVGRRSA